MYYRGYSLRSYMNRRDDAGTEPGHVSRRRLLAATGAVAAGLLAGCSGDGDEPSDRAGNADRADGGGSGDGGQAGGEADGGSTDGGPETSWRTTELTDVLTDETFSIDGIAGPVAVQSFAVWCPKCERQSEELSRVDESVTVVGLNTDPNEDAEKVRRHAERNGFDWRFAVAPTGMTESLIEEFGTAVTNAPSTPIIVACDDGGSEFFSGSQQSAERIESAAAEC